MSFSTVTVAHTWTDLAGNPARGSVSFTLTQPMSNGGVSYPAGMPLIVDLNDDGSISVELAATDDAETSGAGGATYLVTEAIVAATGELASESEYAISVPSASAGQTVDLASLAPNGSGIVTDPGSTIYGTYVSLPEAKEFLQIPGSDTSRDVALQRCVDAACYRVQQLTNRPFGKTLFQPPYGRFNGGSGVNSSYIMLPKWPVIEIVSVVEYQGNNPVTLSEIAPSENGDGFQCNYRTGRLTRILGGVYERPWMPSSEGVLVTWWAGLNPIPGDVWFTTMKLAESFFRSTQQSLAGRGAPNPNAAGDGQGAWPGVPAWVKGSLADYVVPGVS